MDKYHKKIFYKTYENIVSNTLLEKIRNLIEFNILFEPIDDVEEEILGTYYDLRNDEEKAIFYYELSAKKNNILALKDLGMLYLSRVEDSDDVDKNIRNENVKLTIKYLKKILKLGHEEVYIDLGEIYRLIDNYKLAEHYYRMAIDIGDEKGYDKLLKLYYREKKYEAYKKLVYEAIDKGDKIKLRCLSYYYLCIEHDFDRGLNIFHKLYKFNKEEGLDGIIYIYMTIIQNKGIIDFDENSKFFSKDKRIYNEKLKKYLIEAFELKDLSTVIKIQNYINETSDDDFPKYIIEYMKKINKF